MEEKKIDELIALNRKLTEDTSIIKQELLRIRTKMESTLYKVANKYRVLDNGLLVCKNKYKGSIKIYNPINETPVGYVEFD